MYICMTTLQETAVYQRYALDLGHTFCMTRYPGGGCSLLRSSTHTEHTAAGQSTRSRTARLMANRASSPPWPGVRQRYGSCRQREREAQRKGQTNHTQQIQTQDRRGEGGREQRAAGLFRGMERYAPARQTLCRSDRALDATHTPTKHVPHVPDSRRQRHPLPTMQQNTEENTKSSTAPYSTNISQQ